MNKDRRKTCEVLGNICTALPASPSNKVLFSIKDAVEDLATTEKRSLNKMEPHIAKPITRANYETSQLALEYLEAAIELIVDGDVASAGAQLHEVAQIEL